MSLQGKAHPPDVNLETKLYSLGWHKIGVAQKVGGNTLNRDFTTALLAVIRCSFKTSWICGRSHTVGPLCLTDTVQQ